MVFVAIALALSASGWVLLGAVGKLSDEFPQPGPGKIAAEAPAAETPFRVVTVQSKRLNASYAFSYELETADGYLNVEFAQ